MLSATHEKFCTCICKKNGSGADFLLYRESYLLPRIEFNCEIGLLLDPGGGVTTIYAGAGCAIFRVPFFEQKINFGVSFLVKSQVVIIFGVSF